MSSNDDTRYALAGLAGVVSLVVIGVVALAIGQAGRKTAPATQSSDSASSMVAAALAHSEAFAPPDTLYFAVDSEALPPDSDAVLTRVAETVRTQNGVTVLISSFHDATGDPDVTADLAKRRATAVRHALEANGVAPDRLLMNRPEMAAGNAISKDARRVELRLR